MHYSTISLPWKQSKGYLDEHILSDSISMSCRRTGLTPKDSCMSSPSQGEAFSQELIYTAGVITGACLIFSSCHYTFPSCSQIG